MNPSRHPATATVLRDTIKGTIFISRPTAIIHILGASLQVNKIVCTVVCTAVYTLVFEFRFHCLECMDGEEQENKYKNLR
jgi:hypothetical protein